MNEETKRMIELDREWIKGARAGANMAEQGAYTALNHCIQGRMKEIAEAKKEPTDAD